MVTAEKSNSLKQQSQKKSAAATVAWGIYFHVLDKFYCHKVCLHHSVTVYCAVLPRVAIKRWIKHTQCLEVGRNAAAYQQSKRIDHLWINNAACRCRSINLCPETCITLHITSAGELFCSNFTMVNQQLDHMWNENLTSIKSQQSGVSQKKHEFKAKLEKIQHSRLCEKPKPRQK